MRLFLKLRNVSRTTFRNVLTQGFYHGLTNMARSYLDAAIRQAFTSLNVTQAKDLIEKMIVSIYKCK